MTDPLERLRRANPVPAGLPAPPIEPVLRLLDSEPLGQRIHVPHRGAGRLTLVLGGAVAVVVAALAVLLVGRAHISRPSRSAPTTLQSPGGLKGLRTEFGVFRRQQTAADRAFRSLVPGIASLTRLVRRLPNGVSLYLTVSTPVPGPLRTNEHALDTWVVTAQLTRRVSQYIAGTPLLSVPWAAHLGGRFVTWVSVVPDPVQSVEWTFRGGYHVLLPVRSNVAAARIRASLAPVVTSVVWVGKGGRVLSSTQPQAPAAGDGALAGDGVAGVRFGTSHRSAIAQLGVKLSSGPTQSYRPARGACNFDHSAAWGSLYAYFWHGRFVGYQYGSFNGSLHPVLTGPRGLHVGQRIADAKKQFGRAFTTSTAQGGSWALRADHGKLIGYASQPHGGTIVTIDAGSVGCPALTP